MKNRAVFALCGLLFLSVAYPSSSLKAQLVSGDTGQFTSEDPYMEYVKGVETFGNLIRDLKLYYIDSLSTQDLYKNGIRGILSGLDPYCEYYSAQEEEALRLITTGEYGGVGAVVMPGADSSVMVARVFKGKPAQLAGVRPGDVIMKIDGKDFSKSDVQSVSEALKGNPEKQISLELLRRGESKPVFLKFLRKRIQIEPITYFDVRPHSRIGYISIDTFNDKTVSAFDAALSELKQKTELEGLIIDLRGNGGGLMAQAVGILNHFLPNGTEIASLRGRNNRVSSVYRTNAEPTDLHLPVVVLINSETASTSELLAGALQDHDRAVIVGRKSFGKGIVQMTSEMPYGGKLKFTVSRYHIPSGRCVQRIDYSTRSADGREMKTQKQQPDSLHRAFYTKSGRIQHEAGGISPDLEVEADSAKAISYFVAGSYLLQDYATDYHRKHKTIAQPHLFTLSDQEYEELVQRLSVPEFKYELRSPVYLERLREWAESEGFLPEASGAFDSLSQLLKPDKERDLRRYKDQVKESVEEAIISRYYFEDGLIQHRLRRDKDVETAMRLLVNPEQYRNLLHPAK
ncbi:Probable CtpA-like serine protease [Porphyromonas crevioricanis]|uniref:Probable CtpA-like serine protease n=1 Tax=Porphyromonas crevioricanis TaxID=393921 RepID=A0A2X4PP37_9PORP|nr:S41 family peptidase [Porphyromonas crevioricanis]GAD07681.1 carboxyl-terminal protease [Porphyromonas crevioricanis JCM 13913]SQH73633.1 Probable CtpA-like serine protease [Porphyromonas crevioricanis]